MITREDLMEHAYTCYDITKTLICSSKVACLSIN